MDYYPEASFEFLDLEELVSIWILQVITLDWIIVSVLLYIVFGQI